VLSDPLVSRHHARLEWAEGVCHITDLGTANGTRINDSDIEPKERYPLKAGDTIRIGGFTLALRLPAGDEEVTQVPTPLQETIVREAESLTFVAPATPRLIVTTPQWTKEFPLEAPILNLGRDPANDIVVDDLVVSRHHAQLQPVDGGHEIVDVGSANGLTFQGERVPKKLLADGDVLWIAQTVSLTYRTAAEAAETPTASQTLDLRQPATLTIGRHPQNSVTLDHPAVSRNHARIVPHGTQGGYVIEDAGSGNGTFVNGQRIASGEPRPLRPGDVVRVGPIKFVFAPETLEQVDESRDLGLDALHLKKFVGKGLNLLQDISLSIHPREFVAIVGVSGSGKSTLLDALNGFRPATEGAVLVNGTDLYRNFDAYRTDLGYVPQDDTIHKELTVYAALDYAARLRLPADTTPDERRRRIMEVLETLGLTERKDVPIQRLSGGQRKRVCIGAELLTQPGLFFLDEATSGLDPGTESQMMRVLRKLADQGHTVLLVTHATKNVMLCDHVVFLAKGGHLAYYGPPEKALAHFGVEDFDAIYEKLEGESTPEAWAEGYRQSPQYQEFVLARLQRESGAQARMPGVQEVPPPAQPISAPGRGNGARPAAARTAGVSALRQFWILSARYLNIIHRDRMNLALLFLIAPALGTIDLIAWPRNVFDFVEGDATRAMLFLFLGALIPFLVGALSSVREIVKETPVYKRERTVVLRILPYLLSKVWVGFLFALYHAAALFVLKLVAVDLSHLGTQEMTQFYVTLVLSAMSGVMWGLLISALAPREEQAMLLVIVVVVLQIVFSGALVTLSELGLAGEVLGGVTSTKWALQALTTATQVKTGLCEGPSLVDCRLPGLGAFETDPERSVYLAPIDDRYGDVFGADVFASWGGMVLLMVGLFVLLFWFQKRKDVV
jgi:ABC-type multidrug transport system ATPase subunit/pSer/pThr/pTyr-binding forkhead associated (FHA) protein